MRHVAVVQPEGGRGEGRPNIDPIGLWDAGCQVVPLSLGTADPHQQLASGKFLLNGGAGYVLKPRRLRNGAEATRTPFDAPPRKLTKLTLKILCASHLPKPGQARVEREDWQLDDCPFVAEHELSSKPVVHPCVVVEARGGTFAAAAADLDDARHGDVWTSKTVPANGLSPSWMQTAEVGVSDPEMAVLRVSVWDRPPSGGDARFLCYASLPACALRTGYRNVPMRDRDGCKVAFCKMLWHVRTGHTHLPASLGGGGGGGGGGGRDSSAGSMGSCLPRSSSSTRGRLPTHQRHRASATVARQRRHQHQQPLWRRPSRGVRGGARRPGAGQPHAWPRRRACGHCMRARHRRLIDPARRLDRARRGPQGQFRTRGCTRRATAARSYL